jgi:HTH-type transcriptional regulator, competence development regulator
MRPRGDTLGQLLKSTRVTLGRTLRDVEAATGISNGYLSQLESDSIKQPSPNHLHKLADFYRVDYARLMELAGYMPPSRQVAATVRQAPVVFAGLDELTEEDKEKIQAYIEDLRDARRVRSVSSANGSVRAPKV